MRNAWMAIIALVSVFSAPAAGWAVSAEELERMLEAGERLTVIDIRNSALYAEGHIQGAINVPASVLREKRLPPFGVVVVCGDGIREDLALTAVETLNTKRGIEASMLEGGLAAWEALNLPTTEKSGLRPEQFAHLSYSELKKAAAEKSDVVLVDLRGGGGALTDLATEFDGLRVIKPIRRQGKSDLAARLPAKGHADRHRDLYVLIDKGDGEAEKGARRLQAAGIKRLAILTGGELTIQRHGRTSTATAK